MVRLLSISKKKSPVHDGNVRLEGVVCYGNDETKNVWFDIPLEFSDFISERGELWAVLLTPCAMVLGEDLQIDLPVDPLLLENLNGVQDIWAGWYKWVNRIRLVVPPGADLRRPRRASGVCFSGGVDSYYSLVRLNKTFSAKRKAPNYLLLLWGFDIPLSKESEFRGVEALGLDCAARFDSTLIPIATNLRELIGYQFQFDLMTHSAALASVGHLLSNQIGNVVIGSTHDFNRLIPWGSHPLVDPLFSSAETRIFHDGASVDRVEKTRVICEFPAALAELRVCNRKRSRENCSECSKCLRTMVTIDLFNKKESALSFDWSKYSLDRVSKMYLSDQNEVAFALEIVDGAIEYGRNDITKAVKRSLRRSKILKPLDWGLSKLSKVPHIWRYENPLRRALLGRY